MSRWQEIPRVPHPCRVLCDMVGILTFLEDKNPRTRSTNLRQHQALDRLRLASRLVTLDNHSTQPHIPRRRLKPYRHSIKELAHDEFFLNPDHPVIRPAHSHIGD